jgi:hypothetical protein
MEKKYLVVPAQLVESVRALFISGYEDLAEVDPADERSKVKLKRGREELMEAMGLLSFCSSERGQMRFNAEMEAIDEKMRARTTEALKLGECGVWRIVDGELILEG